MNETNVLIRSCLQVHNIGDMAQGPGLVSAMLRSGLPVRPVLWPHGATADDLRWFREALPDVEIVHGSLDADGNVGSAVRDAFDRADVFVHGSQGGPIYLDEIEAWRRHTGGFGAEKPYGFAGITVDPWITMDGATLDDLRRRARQGPSQPIDDRALRLMNDAAFVFCRDSISVEHLERVGVSSLRGFGADSTFGFTFADHAGAERLLVDLGLGSRPFIALVPRLRYTPYAELLGTTPTPVQTAQTAHNEVHAPREFGTVREWIRQDERLQDQGWDVLICPEMSYAPVLGQREFGPHLLGPAADRVRHVPDFWDPAAAAGVYARTELVVSMECHSPILAMAAGTPSLYLRQPTDRAKGAMFDDLGVGDWTVEMGTLTPAGLARAVDAVQQDPTAAAARAAAAVGAASASIETMIGAFVSSAADGRPGSRTAPRAPAAR